MSTLGNFFKSLIGQGTIEADLLEVLPELLSGGTVGTLESIVGIAAKEIAANNPQHPIVVALANAAVATAAAPPSTAGAVLEDVANTAAQAVAANNPTNAAVQAETKAVETVAGNAEAGGATTGTEIAAAGLNAVETAEPSLDPAIETVEGAAALAGGATEADVDAVAKAQEALATS